VKSVVSDRYGARACLCALALLALGLVAARGSAAAHARELDGEWLMMLDVYGTEIPSKLTLHASADTIVGDNDGDPITGTWIGAAVHIRATNRTAVIEFDGKLNGDSLSGTWHQQDVEVMKLHGRFRAERIVRRRPRAPRTFDFTPTSWSREFTVHRAPVLRIAPGGHRAHVDRRFGRGGRARGGPRSVGKSADWPVLRRRRDARRRARRATAQRSPQPRLRNQQRPYRPARARAAHGGADATGGNTVRWKLDRERLVGTPMAASERLKRFQVPLRPMLGCVGVAPWYAAPTAHTGDSGPFGGNIDFDGVVEGSTVYLQVNQPGALLYLGDGHAAQGDGELNGSGLETSMNVEFQVDVIPNKGLASPRVESPTQIMTVGLGGSLDEALRSALAGMTQWLDQDYQLTPAEAAIVLGSAVRLVINEVADRNAGVVAILDKDKLRALNAPPTKPKS
jgi:hypothetical protein